MVEKQEVEVMSVLGDAFKTALILAEKCKDIEEYKEALRELLKSMNEASPN